MLAQNKKMCWLNTLVLLQARFGKAYNVSSNNQVNHSNKAKTYPQCVYSMRMAMFYWGQCLQCHQAILRYLLPAIFLPWAPPGLLSTTVTKKDFSFSVSVWLDCSALHFPLFILKSNVPLQPSSACLLWCIQPILEDPAPHSNQAIQGIQGIFLWGTAKLFWCGRRTGSALRGSFPEPHPSDDLAPQVPLTD